MFGRWLIEETHADERVDEREETGLRLKVGNIQGSHGCIREKIYVYM